MRIQQWGDAPHTGGSGVVAAHLLPLLLPQWLRRKSGFGGFQSHKRLMVAKQERTFLIEFNERHLSPAVSTQQIHMQQRQVRLIFRSNEVPKKKQYDVTARTLFGGEKMSRKEMPWNVFFVKRLLRRLRRQRHCFRRVELFRKVVPNKKYILRLFCPFLRRF